MNPGQAEETVFFAQDIAGKSYKIVAKASADQSANCPFDYSTPDCPPCSGTVIKISQGVYDVFGPEGIFRLTTKDPNELPINIAPPTITAS